MSFAAGLVGTQPEWMQRGTDFTWAQDIAQGVKGLAQDLTRESSVREFWHNRFLATLHFDLEHLELNEQIVTNEDIITISKKCPKLKTLKIFGLEEITKIANGFFSMDKNLYFPCLRSLQLSGCPNFTTLLISAPFLRELHLFDLERLERLEVRAQIDVKIKTILKLGRLPLPLEDADLEKIEEDDDEESLDLSDCKNVTNEGLGNLRKLTHLKKLSLRGCTKITISDWIYEMNKSNLDSFSVIPLLFLEGIDLSNLSMLTAKDISHLLSFKNLTHVDLSDNPTLSDSALSELDGMNWSSLSLSNCHKLTDQAFSHIQKLTSLQNLRINSLTQVTGIGMHYLSTLRLIKLSMSKCKKLTDRGLQHLEGIRTLENVNIKGCPLIKPRAVQSLALAILGIEIISEFSEAPSLDWSHTF